MKVLRGGKYPGWHKKVKCSGSGNGYSGCGALLEIYETDLYNTYRHCRDETDAFITFACCECGAETDIKIIGMVEVLGKRPSDSFLKNLKLQAIEKWKKKMQNPAP